MADDVLIAAVILAGLIAAKPNANPDSHVDQALKTADNLIKEAAKRAFAPQKSP
jgi:hypothetical protein